MLRAEAERINTGDKNVTLQRLESHRMRLLALLQKDLVNNTHVLYQHLIQSEALVLHFEAETNVDMVTHCCKQPRSPWSKHMMVTL